MAETRAQQADEVAERMLLLGSRAVFTGVAAMSRTINLAVGAKNLGTRLVDRLDPSSDGKQRERREHLSRYSALQAVNHVVIIGSFAPDVSPEDELVLAARTASALHDNDVIGTDRVTTIQPAVRAEGTSPDKIRRLDRNVSAIQDAVDLHYGRRYVPLNLAALDALHIEAGASRRNLSAFFEPLRQSTVEAEAFVDDHRDAIGIEGKGRPPMSITLVADSHDILPLFKGFKAADIVDGGVIRMMTPAVWQPLQPHTSVSKPERGGRFTKGGERLREDLPESTPQKTGA